MDDSATGRQQREPVVMVLGRGVWRWVYEGVMVALAVLVVALLPLPNEGWVFVANLAVWGVFVADYVTRLALSTDRKAFFRANLIDLLAIMPVDFFRSLRVLRLARLLRVVRAATIVGRVLREVRGVTSTNGLGWVFLVSLSAVLAGGVVVWIVEPGMDSFPDAVWWSVVTATTVGYGDIAPETAIARVTAVVLMLVGIGTIGMLTGSIATYFIGDGDGSGDPDVEHIRERLAAWSELDPAERRRLADMLALVAHGQAAGAPIRPDAPARAEAPAGADAAADRGS